MKRVSSLSDSQEVKLRAFYDNHEAPQVRKRAHSLLLSHQGYPIKEIADIYDVHPDLVACWIDEWEKDNSLGLYGMARSPIQRSLISKMTYRELVNAFRTLEIPADKPVIVHASPGILGNTQGEKNKFWGALDAVYGPIMAPAFTYQTMTVPGEGPENNAVDYDNPPIDNGDALFFTPDLQPSFPMGKLPEIILDQPYGKRSRHPILSFAGVRVEDALEAQKLSDPLAPIEVLADKGGWVLLVGIDQTANTSIHHAEQLAGRKQFVRWALTPAGSLECPNFPGCAQGFSALSQPIQYYVKKEKLRSTMLAAISLENLIRVTRELIRKDPTALLCENGRCARCEAVRREVRRRGI